MASIGIRSPVLVAVFTLSLTLLVRSAAADENCGSSSTRNTIADVAVVLQAQKTATNAYTLPAGALSEEDLEEAFQSILESGKGIMAFFGMLSDGQQRSISGDVVRQMFDKYGVKLDFLPIGDLEEIRSQDGRLVFKFDFGSRDSVQVRLPDTRLTYLKSGLDSDPYLVDRKNRVKTEESKGRVLKIKDEIQFSVNENGLVGLRDGDISVKVFLLGWIDIDVHSERHESRTATNGRYPLIETDSDGKPLVRDNHYVPSIYDDWVIIEAAGKRIETGVPPLTADQ